MAELTVQSPLREQNDITFTAAANGQTFSNTGHQILLVNNGSGGDVTVSVTITDEVDGEGAGTKDCLVGAGDVGVLGEWPPAAYSNTVTINYSATASVTVAVISIAGIPSAGMLMKRGYIQNLSPGDEGKAVEISATGGLTATNGAPADIAEKTADPTVDDDVDEGYSENDLWYNSTNDTLWLCVDATDGAADWRELIKTNADGSITAIVKPRVDTAVNIDGETLLEDEIAVTDDTYEIRLGDGSTPGGLPVGGHFMYSSGLVYPVREIYDADFVFNSQTLDYDGSHFAVISYEASTYSLRAGIIQTESDSGSRGVASTGFGYAPTASGNYSFAAGQQPQATAEGSVAIGSGPQATAAYAVAIGRSTAAAASDSVALGAAEIEASATGGVAIGSGSEVLNAGPYAMAIMGATAYLPRQFAHGTDRTGDECLVQFHRLTMRTEIVHDDTDWHDIYIEDDSGNDWIPRSDTTTIVELWVVGITSGAAQVWGYVIDAQVTNDGGTVSIETQSTRQTVEDDAAFEIQFTTDGSKLQVQVKDADGGTGDPAKSTTVRWGVVASCLEAMY